MYIPGRSRTCSTPSRTWMLLESYSCAAGFFLGVLFVVTVATGLRSCPRSGLALTGRPRRGTALRGCVTSYQSSATNGLVSQADSGLLPAVSHDDPNRFDDLGAERLIRPSDGSAHAGNGPALPTVRWSPTRSADRPPGPSGAVSAASRSPTIWRHFEASSATGMPREKTSSRIRPSTMSPRLTASPVRVVASRSAIPSRSASGDPRRHGAGAARPTWRAPRRARPPRRRPR